MKRGELLTNDLVRVKLANGKTITGRVALMYYDGEDKIGMIVLNEDLKEVHAIENVTKLVTCYLNDVQVVEEPFEVAANAPYINLPIELAADICDDLLEANIIHSYCIPQLNSSEVIIHK
jgi:hypothetical protein